MGGDRVQITGLQNLAHMNGMFAEIVSHQKKASRWTVSIVGPAIKIAVKNINLSIPSLTKDSDDTRLSPGESARVHGLLGDMAAFNGRWATVSSFNSVTSKYAVIVVGE